MEEYTDKYRESRQVGSKFVVDGVRYKVVKRFLGCKYCDAYLNQKVCALAGYCKEELRNDGCNTAVVMMEE